MAGENSDKTATITLKSIIRNPRNPRTIKDESFKTLCKSIEEFPKMFPLRPIVLESKANPVILGGNQRYAALLHLGFKVIPANYVVYADELNEEERKRFVIADNVQAGEWDFEMLNEDYSAEELEDWGVEVPENIDPSNDEMIGSDDPAKPSMKITFTSPEQLQQAQNDIQELLDRKYKGAFLSVSAGEI